MQKEGIAKKPQTLCREHRAKDGSHPLPPALPSGGKCDRFFVCFLCDEPYALIRSADPQCGAL